MKKLISKAPVAIFFYNRKEKICNSIKSLIKLENTNSFKFYIFSDGPKNSNENDLINEIRSEVKNLTLNLNVEIIEREKNLGLSKSIIEGVNYVFKSYDKIIVLEDDLVIHRQFFSFLQESLEKYEDKKMVYQISGHSYFENNVVSESPFFLPLTNSWGWGTWKDRWEKFLEEKKAYDKNILLKLNKYNFNLKGRYNFFKILKKSFDNKVDSWAILWYYYIFKNNGIVLYPPRSFVKNEGFDGSGTHTILNSKGDLDDNNLNFLYPKEAKVDNKIFEQYQISISNFHKVNVFKKGYLKLKNMLWKK